MSGNQIIPKVEKRLASWLEIRTKIEKQGVPASEPVSITLSREFGCQGYPLAAALQAKLETKTKENWTIFDKGLIEKIADDHNISEHLLANLGERAKYLDYVIAALLPGWKSEEEAYKLITKTVFSIARQGNAIFVGRGAFAITQNLKNCYHYRLIAPFDFRVDTYAKIQGITRQQAESIVREKETTRSNFMQDFYHKDLNGNEFHMIFNNSKMHIERIADTILCSLAEAL